MLILMPVRLQFGANALIRVIFCDTVVHIWKKDLPVLLLQKLTFENVCRKTGWPFIDRSFYKKHVSLGIEASQNVIWPMPRPKEFLKFHYLFTDSSDKGSHKMQKEKKKNLAYRHRNRVG